MEGIERPQFLQAWRAPGGGTVGGTIIESAPTVADGVVYIGVRDGKLYAFGLGPATPRPPARPSPAARRQPCTQANAPTTIGDALEVPLN